MDEGALGAGVRVLRLTWIDRSLSLQEQIGWTMRPYGRSIREVESNRMLAVRLGAAAVEANPILQEEKPKE
jgi:hypothetical protein